MAYTDKQLLDLCRLFESDKITERKNAIDAFISIVDINVVNPEDVWRKLFRSINRCIYSIAERLASTNLSNLQISTTETAMKLCHACLQTTLSRANSEKLYIPGNVIVEKVLEALDSPQLSNRCANVYIQILNKYILSCEKILRDLSPDDWNGLFNLGVELIKKPPKSVDLLTCITFLSLVVKEGCNYTHIGLRISGVLPILAEIFHLEQLKNSTGLQEGLLSLSIVCCKEIAADCRKAVCDFGETIINDILSLYIPSYQVDEKKVLIFELLIIFVQVHHPRGNVHNNYNSIEWRKQLHSIYSMIESEVNIYKSNSYNQTKSKDSPMHPHFICLAVDICKQIFWETNVPSEEAERPTKRIRVVKGFQKFIDLITNCETVSWPWMIILSELLSRYPDSLESTDIIPLLTMIAETQNTCNSDINAEALAKCCNVLIKMKGEFTINVDLSSALWSKIWENTCRQVGLNKYKQGNHKLIRYLFEEGKCNPIQSSCLLLGFEDGSIHKSEDSVLTLLTILKHYQLDTSLENKSSRIQLLNWLLPNVSKNMTCSRISLNIEIEVLACVGLITKTCTEFKNNFGIKCNINQDKTISHEMLYMLLAFQDELIIEKVNKYEKVKDEAHHIVIVDNISEILLDIFENNTLSINDNMNSKLCLIYLNSIIEQTIFVLKLLNYVLMHQIRMKDQLIDGPLTELLLTLIEKVNDYIGVVNHKFEDDIVKDLIIIFDNLFLIFDDTYDSTITMLVRNTITNDFFHAIGEIYIKSLTTVDEDNDSFSTSSTTNSVKTNGFQLYEDASEMKVIDQLSLSILSVFSMYCVVPSSKAENVLSVIYDKEFDIKNSPADFFMCIKILKIMLRSSYIMQDQLEWMLKNVQYMCKYHYNNPEITFKILDLLNGFFSHIHAHTVSFMRHNIVRMLCTFLDRCLGLNYGPKVTIQVLQCLKNLAQVDPQFSWTIISDDVKLHSRVSEYLTSDFVSVRLFTVECLSAMYNLEWLKIAPSSNGSQWLEELFEDIKAKIQKSFLVPGDITPVACIDEKFTRISSALHMFSAIAAINSMFRPKALLILMELKYTKDIEIPLLHSCLDLISKTLNTNKYDLLDSNMFYILSQWQYKITNFPWELTRCNTFVEFLIGYQHYLVILTLQNGEFETYCETIQKSAQVIMKESFPFVLALQLTYRSHKEFTKEDIISKVLYSAMTDIEILEETQNCLPDVALALTSRLSDTEQFTKVFGWREAFPAVTSPTITRDEYIEIINSLQMSINPLDTFIKHLCSSRSKSIQYILTSLVAGIQKSLSLQEKLLNFQKYSIFIDQVGIELADDNSLCHMETFLVRDITYTLTNIITTNNNSNSTKLSIVALKYLFRFCKAILPKCADIFGQFLMFIVGNLVPIAKLDDELGRWTYKYLHYLIVKQNECLADAIINLDPFQSTPKFIELQNVHDRLKYSGKEFTLEDEIRHFLNAGSVKQIDCRAEGLQHLKIKLSTRKDELKQLYQKLYKVQASPEFCANSILHQLICMLVDLTSSKDTQVSLEAASCLGELGPADLTTLVLRGESNKESVSAVVPSFILDLVQQLINLIVDPEIAVVRAAGAALFAILESKEGFDIVKKNKNNTLNLDFVRPFLPKKPRTKSSHLIPEHSLFSKLVDECKIWSPKTSSTHNDWLGKLVSNVLKSFPKDCFLHKLIAVCKAKISFAEFIFPLLIKLVVSNNKENYNDVISRQLQQFFRNHFDNISKNQSNQHDNSLKDMVCLNKASVQVMLNVVHLIRMFDSSSSNKLLELNYLHIAQAAQWCAAYFTSVLYCELWGIYALKDLKEYRNKHHNHHSNPLDYLAEQDGGTAAQTILRESYHAIGDADAIYGCGSTHLFSLNSRMDHYRHEGLWNRVTLHHDLQLSLGQNDSAKYLAQSLQKSGLYYLSNILTQSTEEIDDSQYECAWRLGNWDLNVNDNRKNFSPNLQDDFNKNHYLVLQTLHTGDRTNVFGAIKNARSSVIANLKHASLESTKHLYISAKRLQLLQELEEFAEIGVRCNDFSKVLIKWEQQDKLNPIFEYVEPIRAQRVAMLTEALKINKKLKEPLVETLLDLATLARIEGKPEIAIRNLGKLSKLDLTNDIQGKYIICQAKLEWDNYDKDVAKILLQQLMNDKNQIGTLNGCAALKVYGEWMVETLSENPKVIIEEYFEKCLTTLHTLERKNIQNNEICNKLEVYESLAMFSDSLYQQVDKYMKSPVFENKKKNIEKAEREAEILQRQKGTSEYTKDVGLAIRARRLQNENIDKPEIENTEKERTMYLMSALKYYLLGLQEGDTNNLRVFRVVSLWLENNNLDEVSSLLSANLPLISSHKFLPVLPQLVPRIGDTNASESFTKLLNELLRRCALDHPHHALKLIVTLAFSLRDKEFLQDKRKSKHDIEEPRIRAAKNLLDSLRSTKINEIIHQMETVSLALISFANFEVQDSKAATYVIPKTEPIRKIKNLKYTLVHTYDLPVNKSCNYDGIVTVVKWDDNFTMVGGVNAPKKIICRGTDGLPRVQLLKGKDDLRQDAVMQQVFTIMNSLLRRNKETSKRKLNIRTYKVIPLSQRSGILEWCSNTQPLGVYLLGENKTSGAHNRLRPNDMTYYECFKKFKDIATYAPNDKLKVYLQICERFHPVFQYFFIENYPAPAVWFERRQAYIHSVATTSMVGYILGLGDRHVQNILVDKETGELIHIDFGIAFEQGRILPTPETVPFRLTRDIVAGMGVAGIEGVFRRCCEKTMVVMRQNQEIILTILEVLLYDPLYAWTVSPKKAYNIQRNRNVDCDMTTDITSQTSNTAEVNKMAERALMRLKHKLQGTEEGGGAGMSSVPGQVGRLLQQARDPSNLSKLYVGWSPFL